MGEEKEGGGEKRTEAKKEKQLRLMTSLFVGMRRHKTVCCSHST